MCEPKPNDSHKPAVGIFTMPNQKERAAPFVCNLARRSEAAGREVARILDPDKVSVDVEELMEEIKIRGEHTERRRR